jgi:hypothetical protein
MTFFSATWRIMSPYSVIYKTAGRIQDLNQATLKYSTHYTNLLNTLCVLAVKQSDKEFSFKCSVTN